jgi:SpoVK/Ycf46/Vps4 family AAA+-type ATPase
MMLVGVPGSGKSLIAKTIGTLWNVPVLSVDMGSIYGSLVGESEANLRRLLSTAEAIAPCVLFLDEIEKALAGVNSANDSGVSQRLFGRLLTWMQEKTAPVFVLATANNIAGLPPEFTRKGRFDEIFFVDLPNALEREAILEAHLTRYGVAGVALAEAVAATEGFSGAELAAVVEEALDLMDEDDQATLTPDYLQAAIKATRPLSERSPEALANLREWAKASARPATQRLEPAAKPQNKGKVVMLG